MAQDGSCRRPVFLAVIPLSFPIRTAASEDVLEIHSHVTCLSATFRMRLHLHEQPGNLILSCIACLTTVLLVFDPEGTTGK